MDRQEGVRLVAQQERTWRRYAWLIVAYSPNGKKLGQLGGPYRTYTECLAAIEAKAPGINTFEAAQIRRLNAELHKGLGARWMRGDQEEMD